MELFSKVVFGVLFVITLGSAVLNAQNPSTPGQTELLVTYGLAPRVANATQEMKNQYSFITSKNFLQDPMLMFGVLHVTTKRCSFSLQMKDKLSVAYLQLSKYISPLYMAYSYEENQGPQHTQLAKVLRDISFYLNSTVASLRHELLKRKFPLPGGHVVLSEEQLNQPTRDYLQLFVNKKLLTLVITDDVVKSYRNYVLLYTLHDVMIEIFTCVVGV